MALTNDQVTAKNFKAIVDGMAPFLGAKTQTISETAFEQLSQAEKDNGTAYFVPDATPVTNFMVMGNRFDKANIYTADERMVGSYLGKPLYQKTWTELNVSCQGGSWTTLPFTIADCETIIDVKALRGPYNAFYVIDDIQYVPSLNTIQFTGHETRDDIHTITLQYTKSSDGTVNVGTGNDYSTDEQIIGTWIDGKKLYQKTISHVFTSTATENLMTCTVENIIDISALIFNGANRLQIPFNADGYTCWVGVDNGILKVFRSAGGAWQGASLFVTVQYTKTTD